MKEFIRSIKFLFFSISAGLIELGAYTLLFNFTGLYWPSYLVGLILSVLWNFTLNRKYTFKSGCNIKKAMALVFIYYLVFTPSSTIIGNYIVNNTNIKEIFVTLGCMVVNFVTEYLYQRFVVYRNNIDNIKKFDI